MPVKSYKVYGDSGEAEVVRLIKCPNCDHDLMLLPPSYPLFDVQCKACDFRAQVKSSSSKPTDILRGAGWDIMDKVLKSGKLVPPLIVNFKWKMRGKNRQEVRFYPFIKRSSLQKYTANIKSVGRVYKMFTYKLRGILFFVLYSR